MRKEAAVKPLKSILVPMDFSPNAHEALDQALVMAVRFGARLDVIHVRAIHEDCYTASESPVPKLSDLRRRAGRLAAENPGVDPDSVEIRRDVLHAPFVAPGILDHIRETRPDLVVMGTHGRSGLSRVLLGSVASRVVRMSPVNVLTVGRGKAFTVGESPEEIVAPVDFSEASREAFVHAVELARAVGAKVILLHVINDVPHPAFHLTGRGSVMDIFPGLRNRVLKTMKSWVKEIGAEDVVKETLVADGRVHTKIAEVTREHGGSLIIMAGHGLSGYERLFLGSVTERVIRMAPCPVLTVKTEEERLIPRTEEQADCPMSSQN